MDQPTDRRDFLKMGALTGMSAALGMAGCRAVSSKTQMGVKNSRGSMLEYAAPALDVVRVGFVGVGGMGTNHVKNLLKIDGVQLKAICDIKPERVGAVQQLVVEAGQDKPVGYSKGERDFERMCAQEDLDLVYTATPWRWHVPVCVAAMENGKHAATEVPASTTLEGCWQLVETSEKTRRHCIMMENCCYDRAELLILNLVRKGLLGEIMHGECGYLHDLCRVKFRRDPKTNKPVGEAEWRLDESIHRNGNLYPTHGLGPVAQCMDINRGDKFDYLVSMSTPSRGLNLYAAEHFGADSKLAKQNYALGDVNTSLIRTGRGRTIIVSHDCSLPRPYSRRILVQGTKGIVRKYPEEKIHIEGRSKGHSWEPLDKYFEEFEHPLQKALREKAKGASHGGMDFIEDYRLIRSLRKGLVPDMDVYDGAAWSVVGELSERSVERDSEPVKFPDFTCGKWAMTRPLHSMEV